jgi:hypothetical protein
MPYQGKLVHLLGDLLEIPHVVDCEERIIQLMMFLNPLPDINRTPGLPEVPAPLQLMAAGHLQVEKAFNTRSLRSKQLAAGGQTLTCAIRRSGIGGLDLFTTTSAGFDLLGLGRWWVG